MIIYLHRNLLKSSFRLKGWDKLVADSKKIPKFDVPYIDPVTLEERIGHSDGGWMLGDLTRKECQKF